MMINRVVEGKLCRDLNTEKDFPSFITKYQIFQML